MLLSIFSFINDIKLVKVVSNDVVSGKNYDDLINNGNFGTLIEMSRDKENVIEGEYVRFNCDSNHHGETWNWFVNGEQFKSSVFNHIATSFGAGNNTVAYVSNLIISSLSHMNSNILK